MSDKDFAIGAIAGIPTVGALNKKPPYLVVLEDPSGKKNSCQKFLTLDKPDSQNGFLMVKGFFTECAEEEIIKNFSDILTATPKDTIIEVWLPWHRVVSVRSLVFSANKVTSLSR